MVEGGAVEENIHVHKLYSIQCTLYIPGSSTIKWLKGEEKRRIKCTLYSVHTWIQYKYMVEGGGVEENINVHDELSVHRESNVNPD